MHVTFVGNNEEFGPSVIMFIFYTHKEIKIYFSLGPNIIWIEAQKT